MKKIFTFSAMLLVSVIFLAGCSRSSYNHESEQDYWLSKESGTVVYSDGYCPYYVLETYNGYTIVRSVSGLMPYEGDEVYGDLSRAGYHDLYNYADNTIIRGEITDYWLTYAEAQYAIDNLCYSYNKSPVKKEITKTDKVIKEGKK